ncbi:hypothetical protein G7054_g5423 [Neopestalotiopsis clavispora]|nr:hypothetical protein G7054_g5423 [Neopestalotiopsis clavispora]
MTPLLSWPAILVQVVIILISIAVYRRYLSPLSDIPGPFWASITRLWQVVHIFRGDQNLQSIALHDKYGHFVRIAPNEISVSHPNGPRSLLLTPQRKADWYRVFTVPDYRFETPMSALDPKEKIERSKWLAPGFSLSNILRSEEYMNKNISLLLEWMDKYAESGEPMHLDKYLTYAAFDNAGEVIFSQSFGYIKEGKDIRGSIANNLVLNPFVAAAGFFIWAYVLLVANPVITWTGLMPMGHLFDTANAAMKKRKENPDARFDIAAHWFKAQRENPDRLSDRDIQAQATVAVGAGSDTVSCGIQTFVYHMLRNRNSWLRARQEIVAAQAQGRCRDRVVSFDDAQKLPFLQACIKEALRMFGPTPMGLPRVAPKGGITIGGRHFAEGTTLSIHLHVMQQSKECWGPDAREWNPDRWFADDAASKEKYWLVLIPRRPGPGKHISQLCHILGL